MKRLTTREDAFEELLEGRADGDVPPEIEHLARLARALETRPARPGAAAAPARPAMRPAFRASLRARLLTEASGRRPLVERARDWWVERNAAMRRSLRVAVAMSAATMVLLAGSVVMAASQSAIPGDSTYWAKRLRERGNLAMTRGDESRGYAFAGLAKRRLSEVGALVDRGVTKETLYVGTLGDMSRDTSEAHRLLVRVFKRTRDAFPLRQIDGLALAEMDTLTSLMDRIPPGARAAARTSIELATSVRGETQDLLKGCPCEETLSPAPPAPLPGRVGSAPCECEPRPGEHPESGSTTEPGIQPAGPTESSPTPPPSEPSPTPDANTLPDVPGTGVDDDAEEIIEDLLSPVPTPPLASGPASNPLGDILPPLPTASLSPGLPGL
ncbi:MAG: hypothetical protein HY775_11855 [Acidobacteria bacterium]|nr:hypothetical protein [Acidobacteriota bacterium]